VATATSATERAYLARMGRGSLEAAGASAVALGARGSSTTVSDMGSLVQLHLADEL
jgi:hypothetical protein